MAITSRQRSILFTGVLVGVVVVAITVTLVMVFVVNSSSSSSSGSKGARVTDSLKFIVVLSRHGNRGSDTDYFNDPYPLNDTKYWPYGKYGLTPQGRVQMYRLGERVRTLYNGFLNSTYHAEELHASSTYMDRLLMSGEGFLAGLYPPHGWQVWDNDIPWQPTPIYSDSPDKTINIEVDCPRFYVDFDAGMGNFLKTYANNITTLIELFNNATGSNVRGYTSISTLFHLWDKLTSEETEKYTIPEWTKVLYPYPLQSLMAQEYIAYYAGTDEIVRLLIGGLFDEILDVARSVINGTQTERKVQYYSGHDSSIVALQVVLGIPRSSVRGMIKPGSALVLELHQESSSSPYTVQALYIDGSSADLDTTNMTMPSCGDPCTFDTLVNISTRFTGVNYDAECQNVSSLYVRRSRPTMVFN